MPIYASGPYTALFFSIVAGDLKIVVPRNHAVGSKGDLVTTLVTADPKYIDVHRTYQIR